MMKKVSLGQIKVSLTKRSEKSSNRPTSVNGNGDLVNGEVSNCSSSYFDDGCNQRTSCSKGKQTVRRSGLFKTLQRKLRARPTVSECEECNENFKDCDRGSNGGRQSISRLSSVCPMPSPVFASRRSSSRGDEISAIEVEAQDSGRNSTAGRIRVSHKSDSGDAWTLPRRASAAGEDENIRNLQHMNFSSGSLLNNHSAMQEMPPNHSLTRELFKLSKYGWYWGPITRSEAEEKLLDQPDGAFLVRDSSDDHYLLSLSFRSYGKTLHTRIEHSNGMFSFYAQSEPEGHPSIIDLIEHSMNYSQAGAFCYSRARSPGSPSFPVRLTKPVSRFTQVRSLQYLCRFVIRQYTRFDHIQRLPLPNRVKGYIEEGHY